MPGKKQRSLREVPQGIGYTEFLEMLAEEFPEAVQAFSKYDKGLLHCEVGVFARLTEEAIDEGNFWRAERYFRFIDRVRRQAALDVANAIDVSYIEYLAFSEVTDNRLHAVKRLMPKAMRETLRKIDGRGRWA